MATANTSATTKTDEHGYKYRVIKDWNELEAVLGESNVLMATIDKGNQAYLKKEAAYKQKTADLLEAMTKAHAPSEIIVGQNAYGIMRFCEANKGELGEEKLRELKNGVVGFYEGKEKVDVPATTTMDKAIAACKKAGAKFAGFLRVKNTVELDKAALLKNHKLYEKTAGKEGIKPALIKSKLGIEVVKEEFFRIDYACGSVHERHGK